ncbi:structural maintenance of chromosomes protein 6-like isoform X3 [Neodiprion virginianus]|uniref:structural maintenance of chromosomes protein 6-like isoform X3 n=1 Tax=Neodiprion virginianus TaxID=2961670 RepID=UPI001EE6ACD6|nr:structural maintenance of chromosomes protein 6-like isoform X3 [Neodiprion virginianus]
MPSDKKKLKLDLTGKEHAYANFTKNDCAKEDVANPGQIMRLYMNNFLNYENWELKFNHNVNFIMTENFHGKSTIFHALSLGLGGGLNRVGRGGTLRDFIKNTELPATIRITLCNKQESSDKSNPSEDYIIIQCTIRTWGNVHHRTYKLLSDKDDVESVDISVSDLRKQIKSMRNIEWDHPVLTMSQIESMKLSTIDPKKFYEDLMTASGLRTIDNDSFIVMNRLKMNKTKKQLDFLNNEISKIKEMKEMQQSTIVDRENLVDLKKQLQWSMVKDLKKIQDVMDGLKAERKQWEELMRKKKEYVMKLQKRHKKVEKDIKALDDLGRRVASNKRKLALRITEKEKLQKETAKMKKHMNIYRQEIKKFDLMCIEAKLKEKEEIKVKLSGELEDLKRALKQLQADFELSIKGMDMMGSSNTLVANCCTEQSRIHLIDILLDKMQNELQSMMATYHDLKTQQESSNKKLEAKNSDLDQIKEVIANYESRKQNIINSMDVTNDNISLPDTFEELNATIQDLTKKIDNNATNQKKLKKAKKELQVAIFEDEIKIFDTSYDKLNGNRSKYRKSIAAQKMILVKVCKACTSIDNKLQKFQRTVENLEADMKKENFTIESIVSDATTLCPDMNPQRSTVEINQEIKQVEKRIAAAKQQQASYIRQMTADLEKISKEFDETVKSIHDMEAVQKNHMQLTLNLSINMEEDICKTMQEEFGRLVDIGGCKNYLIIDSGKKKLQVPMNSFGGNKEAEKYFNIPDSEILSYYILAFTLAFWKCCVDVAFYIIDNINFPQESVIGKFANKIVLEHVMKHPDRQFIIFNQLTDSHSIRADHVTYHRPPALQETPGTSSQSDK